MGTDRTDTFAFFWSRTAIATVHIKQSDLTVNTMKLSERQLKTLGNVKLNYGPLCNKRTLVSLEKKGLIQWYFSCRWILTESGFNVLNNIKKDL